MKTTQRDFANTAQRAAQNCQLFFFCGPDEAGASAAANRIAELLDEPGERVELNGAQLRADPAVLGDEARSASLFGDKRHIFVRASGDEALEALKALIETNDAGAGEAAPVLVHATSATDKSRTAKLLEKRKDALVAMFWPPDLNSVTATVRQMADAEGLRLGGDIAQRIARGAGLDVRLAQSEVTKLAIYMDASQQSPREVTLDDLEAIGATTEDDGFRPLVHAVLAGERRKLGDELRRMREQRINPVGLLLAVERRAAQLLRIKAHMGTRGDLHELGKGEKAQLGIFFKEEREISEQLGKWSRPQKLERLIERLMATHRRLLSNSQSAELLLAQELTEIAANAHSK